MKTMTRVSVVALALALASPSLAEQPRSTDSAASTTTFVTAANASDMRTSEWIGAPVQNASNETVGNINDFVIGNDGNIVAIVAGVGGFLGLGEKNVGLSYENVELTRSSDGGRVAKVLVSKDELMNAPDFQLGKKTLRERAKEASDAASETYEKAKDNVKAGYEAAKESVKRNYEAAKESMAGDENKPASSPNRQ